MNIPETLSDWIVKAVVGAVLAAIGYFSRFLIERSEKYRQRQQSKLEKQRQEQRQIRESNISKLDELQKLLFASKTLFDIQQTKIHALMTELERNHPNECTTETGGYEATFMRCFKLMNDSEKALHGIIRAYTEFPIRSVNEAMSNWLQADMLFMTGAVMFRNSEDLAEKLRMLQIHLLLWRAKYEYWIPNKPEHALVYMADEEQHGLGFPSGTDDAVKDALLELRK